MFIIFCNNNFLFYVVLIYILLADSNLANLIADVEFSPLANNNTKINFPTYGWESRAQRLNCHDEVWVWEDKLFVLDYC